MWSSDQLCLSSGCFCLHCSSETYASWLTRGMASKSRLSLASFGICPVSCRHSTMISHTGLKNRDLCLLDTLPPQRDNPNPPKALLLSQGRTHKTSALQSMEELPAREVSLPSGCCLEVWVGEWQPTAAGKETWQLVTVSSKSPALLLHQHQNSKKKLVLF